MNAGHGSDLAADGRAIIERLGGRWTQGGGLCRCPAHDDRTPSLSVRLGRRRLLFHCFAGCDAASILAALGAAGLSGRAGALASEEQERSGRSLTGAALRLWGAARPIGGSPARHYLEARGIDAASPELRYHSRAPHGPKPLTRYRPALIAAVREDTGLVAVHRTFLNPRAASLAAVENPKCALGPLGRGAIRFGGAAPKMGLAEGIETALSATRLFDLPCWATLGTERFALVNLPTDVSELVLFLDNDGGGRRAEALAREKLGHIPSIEARYPPRPGDDWNDVLRAHSSVG